MRQATYYSVHVGVPSEVDNIFLQGMADRMAVSFHKYGAVKNSTSDHVESLKKRLEKYEEDGNLEWLMDVANWAMIEFMHPRHPKAHYNPDAPSIGRITMSGRVTEETHEETVRRGFSGSMARERIDGD